MENEGGHGMGCIVNLSAPFMWRLYAYLGYAKQRLVTWDNKVLIHSSLEFPHKKKNPQNSWKRCLKKNKGPIVKVSGSKKCRK